MDKKKYIKYLKFSIDLVMGITFVLFFNKRVLGGLTFHEIAGLMIAVVFFTHIILNWKWVKNVTLKLFDRRLPFRTKFSYLLNLLLLVGMAFIITSGIFISRVVFPNINIGNEQWFKVSHMSISFLVLIIVAIHIGLHWKWIMNVFKNIVKIKHSKKSLKIVSQIAVVLLLVFGSYEMYNTQFLKQVQGVSRIFNLSSSMPDGGFKDGNRPDSMHGNFAKSEKPPIPSRGDIDESESSTSVQSSNGGDRPPLPEGKFHGGKGHEMGNSSVFGVITQYFAIMSVIIILIYYIEKFILRTKKKRNLQGNV